MATAQQLFGQTSLGGLIASGIGVWYNYATKGSAATASQLKNSRWTARQTASGLELLVDNTGLGDFKLNINDQSQSNLYLESLRYYFRTGGLPIDIYSAQGTTPVGSAVYKKNVVRLIPKKTGKTIELKIEEPGLGHAEAKIFYYNNGNVKLRRFKLYNPNGRLVMDVKPKISQYYVSARNIYVFFSRAYFKHFRYPL